ncbi:MAG: endonuclease/exonuclease/phosphatase family protein [Planctomycetota bacterium]
MQRLISLAVLALVAGGGWTYLQNSSPGTVQRAVQAVGNAVRQAPGITPSQPTGPQAGGYNQPPAYGGGYVSGPAGFAPPPQPGAAPTIRIAAFNIQTFGQAKASKPYVMDAIARVVRSFDVIAIQEIRTQDDRFIPNFLRDYVNKGVTSGHMYDARVSPRLGRTQSTEQYAFLFNTATIEVHPQFCAVIPDPEDRLHREPYAALFRTRIVAPYKPFTFTLINIHTDPDEAAEEIDALYHVYRQVQRTTIDGAVEDDVILLGDLNTAVPAASRYTPNADRRPLSPRDLGLLARIPGIAPLIRNEATNVRGSRLHDNLLIPSLTTIEYLNHGVMDLRTQLGYTLTQDQVLQISDHLPVWGEFSAIEGDSYRSAAR